MQVCSSSAVEGKGRTAKPRFVLALLLALGALFAASLRPAPLAVVATTRAFVPDEADVPVAIDETDPQCRVPAVRPARDGHRPQGTRARDVALAPPPFPGARWTAQAPVLGAGEPASPSEAPSKRRVRRHLELMVLLT